MIQFLYAQIYFILGCYLFSQCKQIIKDISTIFYYLLLPSTKLIQQSQDQIKQLYLLQQQVNIVYLFVTQHHGAEQLKSFSSKRIWFFFILNSDGKLCGQGLHDETMIDLARGVFDEIAKNLVTVNSQLSQFRSQRKDDQFKMGQKATAKDCAGQMIVMLSQLDQKDKDLFLQLFFRNRCCQFFYYTYNELLIEIGFQKRWFVLNNCLKQSNMLLKEVFGSVHEQFLQVVSNFTWQKQRLFFCYLQEGGKEGDNRAKIVLPTAEVLKRKIAVFDNQFQAVRVHFQHLTKQ